MSDSEEIMSDSEEDEPCVTTLIDFSKSRIGSTVVEIDNFGNKVILHPSVIITKLTEKCCREEGATVTLELSASRERLLAVKKDRSTKYAYKPDKILRPCSCNQFTHAIIWTGDDNWKLEFRNRQEWGCQVKKAPLVPKPFLRKRRSFKCQVSHGRCKQPNLLQALDAEHDSFTKQNTVIKVEEARMSATRYLESAILKRQEAQLLMQNADMDAYKAIMALRIAEAARFTESLDGTVA
ncbi:hypothetical protein PTKIN_Ptkin16aG0076600 [Pterospermum kingtungense]